MGFKCSVFGHRFEEPGLVNEREERGDEVIDIKRRVMVCSICGERRVLAERKEITKHTDTDEGTGVDDETEDDRTDSEEPDDSEEEKESDSPEIDEMDSGESGFAGVDIVDSEAEETAGSTPESQRDDGMVPSGMNAETDRPGSDWSTRPNDRFEDSWHPATETNHSRRKRGGQTGSDSITAATDDGEILASSTNEPTEPTEKTDSESDSGGSDGETWDDRATADGPQEQPDIMDKRLSCSTCGFSVFAADSPFRAGDICPRCHDAYLTETAGTRHSDRVSGCRQSTE